LGGELGGPPSGEELGGPPPPPPGGETVPEGKGNNYNILLEGDFLTPNDYLDLGKGRKSLGDMDGELDRLLNS
jgi:hypothetical protein